MVKCDNVPQLLPVFTDVFFEGFLKRSPLRRFALLPR